MSATLFRVLLTSLDLYLNNHPFLPSSRHNLILVQSAGSV